MSRQDVAYVTLISADSKSQHTLAQIHSPARAHYLTEAVTALFYSDFRFIIPREAALGSGFLTDAISQSNRPLGSRWLTFPTAPTPAWLANRLGRLAGDAGGFSEGQTGVITLEYRNDIVEKVCEYLMYKLRWTGSKEDPPDFQPRVQPEIALEL